MPTRFTWLALLSEDTLTDYENKTLYVGTKVRIAAYLQYQKPDGTWANLENKKSLVHFYHKLDTGAWEDLGTGDTPRSASIYEIFYTLPKAGTHRFYAEFLGDDYYAGCPASAKALLAQGEVPPPPTVPEWLIGLGIVAGACVLTLAVTKALKWW
jgi:hypothetical protein